MYRKRKLIEGNDRRNDFIILRLIIHIYVEEFVTNMTTNLLSLASHSLPSCSKGLLCPLNVTGIMDNIN